MIRFPLFMMVLLSAQAVAGTRTFESTVEPFVAKNCVLCHNAKAHTADLNLAKYKSSEEMLQDREIWERVLSKVQNNEMPPKGLPRPPAVDVKAVTDWIAAEFDRSDSAQKPDPGRVTARRLNRYEYNNTVRDLLAVNFRPANDFPADDSGYGFDNIGDVLSLSPALMEKYLAAADKIARTAVPLDSLPKPTRQRLNSKWKAGSPAGFSVMYNFPAEGDYEVWVNVSGRHDPLLLTASVTGSAQQTASVHTNTENPRYLEFKLHVPYGGHLIQTSLALDPTRPVVALKADQARPKQPAAPDPHISYVEVHGPYHPLPPPVSESYRRVFVCGHPAGHHTAACVRTNLAQLARRAYRRPVTAKELDGLIRFVNMATSQGESLDYGMQVAVKALLVSPHFLFRVERDPDPSNPALAHRLSDYELATRVSYFLWSSMPDEELSHLAENGQLHEPNVLEAQVRRMLRDPKANALIENFGGQWLELRNLSSVKPDPDKFAMFDAELRKDMRRETELFFGALIREDRSILDFVDARYTYLNERLAKFYGIPGVEGNEFRRVELPADSPRGGVLTQASILTVSSYPNRTSPVVRGKYILENFLNDPPPPPPANVPALDDSGIGISGSMRQQLEKHRANPVCASCHARMDPLGFGLENFDAIGRWRTHDGKFAVDSTGTLPNGKSFEGPVQLKQILLANSNAFAGCLAEKLLIYGLGRGLQRFDRPAVQLISRRTAADGYRFSRLIVEVVNSMPFQMRRGEALPATSQIASAAKTQGGQVR